MSFLNSYVISCLNTVNCSQQVAIFINELLLRVYVCVRVQFSGLWVFGEEERAVLLFAEKSAVGKSDREERGVPGLLCAGSNRFWRIPCHLVDPRGRIRSRRRRRRRGPT